MGPERKLYQKIKKNITSISWIRLENLSSSGTPDRDWETLSFI